MKSRLAVPCLVLLAALWLAARPSPASSAATVSFYTTPKGAEVYLDNVRLGMTPLKLWTVQAGTHVVRFVKAGWKPIRFGFTIRAGETRNLRRTLYR
jgi:hypothetical protein